MFFSIYMYHKGFYHSIIDFSWMLFLIACSTLVFGVNSRSAMRVPPIKPKMIPTACPNIYFPYDIMILILYKKQKQNRSYQYLIFLSRYKIKIEINSLNLFDLYLNKKHRLIKESFLNYL